MVSKDRALQLIQEDYYGAIDDGDIDRAVSTVHEEFMMIHTQIWEGGGLSREDRGTQTVEGRDDLEEYLNELNDRSDPNDQPELSHEVDEFIWNGRKGAFLGRVVGDTDEEPFFGWLEIEDEKLLKYILTPVEY